MKVKRLRAVSAMSNTEFDERFPNEKAAIDHFINIRYKGNLVCPHCGSTINIYRERERPKVFHCSTCNNSFSPLKGTIFEKTHIEIIVWFKAIREFLNDRKGYSACQLQRDTEFTYKTAWRMLHQIRIAMSNRKMEECFEGLVEIDETYVGGKPRKGNAILDKDGNVIKSGKLSPAKRGRGTKKTPVVGVKERSTGKVYATVMLPNKEGQALTGKQLPPIILNSVFTQSIDEEIYCDIRTIDILREQLHKDYKDNLTNYNKYVPSDEELESLVGYTDYQENHTDRIQEYNDHLGIVDIVGSFFAIKINSGSDSSFTLPIKPDTTNNLTIDWGDGSAEQIVNTAPSTGTTYTGIPHTFPAANTNYQIKMYGTSIVTATPSSSNRGKCGFGFMGNKESPEQAPGY
jgi:transposase-like protein